MLLYHLTPLTQYTSVYSYNTLSGGQVRGLVQTIFEENNVILTLCFTPHNVTCLPRARRRCPVSSLETSLVLTPPPTRHFDVIFYKNSLDTPPTALKLSPKLVLALEQLYDESLGSGPQSLHYCHYTTARAKYILWHRREKLRVCSADDSK